MPPNPQYVILFHHFRRLLEAAAKEGIDVAPLKGAHLLTSVYPEDEDRGMMADVDFLVRPRDWSRILELIGDTDFAKRDHFADEERQSHEVGFHLQLDDERHILFEVHRYILNPRRWPLDHEAIWSRSVESTFEDAPCRRLAPEDHFVHIAVHAAIHRFDFIERTVRDLELLVRQGGLDPELVVERAREWGGTRIAWLMLSLIDEHAQEPLLNDQIRALAPPLPIRRAIRFFIPSTTSTRVARLHHRARAAVLWPLLFDSPVRLTRFVANHPKLGGRRGLPEI